MGLYYIYMFLLLFMFILIYRGIYCSIKFSPVKIKYFGVTFLAVLSLRYIALILLLIVKNIKYLYLLKPFVFLNLLCIPVLAFLSLYILARNDKIRLTYTFIFIIVLLAAYISMIIFSPGSITSPGSFGYRFTIGNKDIAAGIYLLINTVLFLYSIVLLDDRGSNKFGMMLILVSALSVIVEIIIGKAGIIIFPAIIIGDALWIITVNFALYRFKK